MKVKFVVSAVALAFALLLSSGCGPGVFYFTLRQDDTYDMTTGPPGNVRVVIHQAHSAAIAGYVYSIVCKQNIECTAGYIWKASGSGANMTSIEVGVWAYALSSPQMLGNLKYEIVQKINEGDISVNNPPGSACLILQVGTDLKWARVPANSLGCKWTEIHYDGPSGEPASVPSVAKPASVERVWDTNHWAPAA